MPLLARLLTRLVLFGLVVGLPYTFVRVDVFHQASQASPHKGTTRFVSTHGTDAGNCTSQPCRTIPYAYDQAGSGDTILVADGVYSYHQPRWGLRLDKSVPITLKAQHRWKAVLDAQNSPDWASVVYITGSHQTVEGFEIKNGWAGGIVLYGNANRIVGNHIHACGNTGPNTQNGQDGIYSDAKTSGNLYLGNYIDHNGRPGSNLDHGLYLCGSDEVVVNNLLVCNASYGLQIAGYDTVHNMRVYNNVMAYNGRSGIVLWQAVKGIAIQNNIFYKNAHYAINSWDAHGSGVEIDHNLSYGNPSGDYDFTEGGSDYTYKLGVTIHADPLFVAPDSGDFHINARSPAIDRGQALSQNLTDFEGTRRPQGAACDIGAYERRR